MGKTATNNLLSPVISESDAHEQRKFIGTTEFFAQDEKNGTKFTQPQLSGQLMMTEQPTNAIYTNVKLQEQSDEDTPTMAAQRQTS